LREVLPQACRKSNEKTKGKTKMARRNPRHFLRLEALKKGFFYSLNVEGKGRCAVLYRAASSDRRERP